jgi:NAD(P)-dependent dehydrogenase (short-subunit alcohol dehydrogenase family)
MLAKVLALFWAPEGSRVNAVAPGYIETSINEAGWQDLAHYGRIAERFKGGGQPEDVAGTVVFLCMPRSSYASGAVVAVDGGFLLAKRSPARRPDQRISPVVITTGEK